MSCTLCGDAFRPKEIMKSTSIGGVPAIVHPSCLKFHKQGKKK